ncbi:MAG: gliding motility-associated C-terminal domain-containing protein [Bacteroidetes bacterium]|nr:gliding motility-associated C-terminal domain-containing protein [Bacteroidota bacterium]
MKRILYSCLPIIFLLLSGTYKAQTMQYTIGANPQCYVSPGPFTFPVGLLVQPVNAASYSWTVLSPSGGCTPTIISTFPPPPAVPSHSQALIAVPCAGEYTVVLEAYDINGFLVATVNGANTVVPVFGNPSVITVVNTAGGAVVTTTPGSGALCLGQTATLSAQTSPTSAALSFVWSDANGTFATTNTIVVTPTASTSYSVDITDNTVLCTYNTVVQTVVVQTDTISILPSSQTICVGGTTTLIAQPGPGVVSYTWSTGANTPTAAVSPGGGVGTTTNYTVVATFNGPAGSCTASNTSSVTVDNALSVFLTSSDYSVCPGATFTLTANPGNAASTYSWLSSTTPSAETVPNILTPTISVPTTFTVDADFIGTPNCPGTGTVFIDIKTLTPTIGIVSPTNAIAHNSICAGSAITFSADGGATYSFVASPTNTLTNSANTATDAPLTLPQQYVVHAYSLGCTGTASIDIYAYALQPTLAASSISNCPNSTFTLFSNPDHYTYTFEPVPPNTNTLAVENATSVTSSSGVFPVTYSVLADSSGCIGTSAITIYSLNFTPTLVTTVPHNSICPGNTFTLEAKGGGTYTIDAPGSSTLSSQNGNFVTYSVGILPSTFTLTMDSSTCLGGTTTIDIYEMVLTPTLFASSASVCANTDFTLNTNYCNGVTSHSFYALPLGATVPSTLLQQNPPLPTTCSVTASQTILTTYTTVIDSAGCVATATIDVDMMPPLTPIIAYTSPTVCAGQESTLSILNQPTTYTISWVVITPPSNTPMVFSTDSIVVVTPSVFTNYTVNVKDDLGCIGSATVDIGINPAPLLSLTTTASPYTICPGQTTTLSVSGGFSYTWSPASVVTPVNGSFVVGSPSVTTVYTVTGNNGYGCMGTKTVGVLMANYPNLSIASTGNAVCAGFHATLTAFGANTYTWAGTTFTNPIYQQSIAVTPGTYTLFGSNGGSCLRDTSKIIVLQPNYSLTISQTSPTTCITNNYPYKYSKPVTLTASGGGGVYTWFAYHPMYMTYSIGPVTDVMPSATTCYTVTNVGTACSGSAATCVTVIPQFTMNVTPPLPAICIGDSIKLTIVNIGTLAVGAPSTYTYNWTEPTYIPGLNIPSMDELMSLAPTVWPNKTATYSVEVRDIRQCVSVPRLVTVTVFPRPETAVLIPTINMVPTNTLCYVGNLAGSSNNLLELSALNMNKELPEGVVPTYTWMPPAPYYTSTPVYDPILTSRFNPRVTIKAPKREPAVVTYTVKSGYNGVPGCVRYDTISVRIVDCRPVNNNNIGFISDEREICTRQCVNFINLVDTAAGGPQKYYWQFPGGAPGTSTLSNPTVCYNLPGARNVILSVSNPYASAAGADTSFGTTWRMGFINAMDVPNVTIIPPGELKSDTTIRFGQSVRLNATGAVSYSWSPDYNITSKTSPSVVVTPYRTTQYILRGYNNKSCFSSDTINVIVVEDCGEMYVPNAFSPNGDGHNDRLYVRGICLKSFTFMVFDRWGEKVFETTQQDVGWDGTYKGEDMNSGVFVYRLEGKTYDNKAFSLKGNVTLIR